MSTSVPVYHQLLNLLRQHSNYRDFRHLKALAWMINALICSGTINLSQWEAYVPTLARQAQSTERRWQRFLRNPRVKIRSLYISLVMAAIDGWHTQGTILMPKLRIISCFFDYYSGNSIRGIIW